MAVVPAATPITSPVEEMVAAPGVLLVHTPPVVASVNVIVEPTHTLDAPEIAAGTGLTVTKNVFAQPVPSVYVIMAVPGETPVTSPVPDPMVATLRLPLLHVPPADTSLRFVVNPTHTYADPVIAAGSGLTVMGDVVKQPVPNL